jgi:hypothetical protein
MRTVAILQEEVSKMLIQSELSSTAQIGASTLIKTNNEINIFDVYPNPANQYITVVGMSKKYLTTNYANQFGQVIMNGKISDLNKESMFLL